MDIASLLPDIKISNNDAFNNEKDKYDKLSNQLITVKNEFYNAKDDNERENLLQSLNVIEDSVKKADRQLKRLEEEDVSNQMLIKGIKARSHNLNSSYYNLVENLNKIVKLNSNFNNYIDKVIHPNINFHEYQKIVDGKDYDSVKKNVEEVFLLERKNMKYAYSVINFYRINSLNYLQNLNDFSYYINDSRLQNKVKNGDYILKQITNEIEKAKAKLKDFDALVDEINLPKKLNHIEIINRMMQNEATFEYTSVPIQGVEDFVEFNVNVESRKSITTDYYPDNKKSFRYFEYLKGGVRLDFSAGVVMNFGSIDKNYSIQNNVIRKNSDNEFIPDLGVFVHSNFRNSSSWAPGISLGTSLDISKFNINSFYLGGSVLIGKRNKVIITAGPAFRLTQELNNNFSEYDQVQGIEDVNDILTKNFKIGAFLALTYNLTNKQKGLIKIPQQ